MLPAAEAMTRELEQEARSTRRVLERIPEDKLTWKPHPKSMTIGQLAGHVAAIPGRISRMAQQDGFERPANPGLPTQIETTAGLLPDLEAGLADTRALLAGLTAETAAAPWRMTFAGHEVFAVPRLAMLRSMLFNHWYHHRGELLVYLRLLDVPVPAVYGRSADEDPIADAARGAAS